MSKTLNFYKRKEWEKHQFAVLVVIIIGSGKNFLDAKAATGSLLGGQDHHPISEDCLTACLVISKGKNVPLQTERSGTIHLNQMVTLNISNNGTSMHLLPRTRCFCKYMPIRQTVMRDFLQDTWNWPEVILLAFCTLIIPGSLKNIFFCLFIL